ncbi:MAG TPA: NAD-binding protein [Longimicrobiaceae bacterium]|nr:NAD-binding protein [Longimicrobiaceae bacterium]
MKFLPSQLAYLVSNQSTKRDLKSLWKFVIFLVVLVVIYTIVFHILMAAEGQTHSWITGFYWTLTVMSTLGFGDITFQSDAGRVFSIVVLMSGVIFLLVVLPFTFIQFFYAPWLEAQSRNRAARSVPEGTKGHVILTQYDPVTISLMDRLKHHGRLFYLLESDLATALELHDDGVPVIVGDRDKLETYVKLRAADAALIVATGDDYVNTNIAFTVRELSNDVPIVAIARAPESIDILELAGASHVIQLPEMLGRSLGRRALGGDSRANIIGQFGDLLIAEAPMTGTPWVNKLLAASQLREATGLTVVGIWKRGHLEIPTPDSQIESTTVLVLAGSEEQFANFTELTTIYNVSETPVLILGGGRVGRAAAHALKEREIPYRVIEKDPSRIRHPDVYVLGSAADIDVLEKAGIRDAPTAIVTTNDDATNIYLTIYCRRLRPDIQIISRATLERNVSTLHRAGADFVMSYASMGANAIFNTLEMGDVVMLAEGIDIFRFPVPRELAGLSLMESNIRHDTGCSVMAIEHNGESLISPPPDMMLPATAELILIGTTEGERRFLARYGG